MVIYLFIVNTNNGVEGDNLTSVTVHIQTQETIILKERLSNNVHSK